ncbi:hypothetical protein ALQ93_200152 [Pseudomonas syringae pv. pisi]|nr:hypothetical protein ALQ93_200152 [Pseudomonas syringae pv. pisi]
MILLQLQVFAGHEGIEGRNDVFGQLPILRIDRPRNVGQTQIASLLVFVLAAINSVGQAVSCFAGHVAWKTVLCRDLNGFVVAEVKHFDRRVMRGVTDECCCLPGTGKRLDQ